MSLMIISRNIIKRDIVKTLKMLLFSSFCPTLACTIPKAFPASVTKQLALIPSQLPTWPWYVRIYTTDEMTVTFSSTIPEDTVFM